MRENEANKIIANYMGVPWCPCNDGIEVEAHDLHPKYTESLDALVPVWQELEKTILKPVVFRAWMKSTEEWGFRLWEIQSHTAHGRTIQEAAAIATARAALEKVRSE